jgi:pimeloyl-ACP methyl ester carboxylesterase
MLNIQAGWTLGPEYDRVAWNSALTYDMIFTQPVLYEFPHVQPQTLLIIGDLDRTALGKNLVADSIARTMGDYPALGRQTQAKIPHCQLAILPGVGHVPHAEAFDSFANTLLTFLQH